MKRLQFRNNDTVFETRESVLKYFEDIVDSTNTASTVFKSSLYAEPLVAKYLDEDGNTQIIFAIGVDSGLTKYHTIDSKELYELISQNAEAIEFETARAITAESGLQSNIDTERERAQNAEEDLLQKINAEIDRAIDAEEDLQQQFNNNLSTIVAVEPSSANILEEYALKNSLGEKLGESVKIYKDSSLVGATIGFKGAASVVKEEDGTFTLIYNESERDENIEYLYLIYKNEVGELKIIGIDFENFLMEAEFGDGLKIIDHVVSIKIKDGEKYITATKDGLQTVNIDNVIEDAVADINNKIDSEIERSTAADNFISSTTYAFSSSVLSEIEKIIASETFLSGAIETEREERIAEDNTIKAELKSGRLVSKDIVISKKEDGTSLTIQTDEVTLTKFASASTIYDTNVAILGTLLKVKKVEPTSVSVKSRYELQDGNGQLVGDPIEMMVESALIDVRQGKEGDAIDPKTGNYITEGTGDTTMNFVYRLEDGSYELMQIVVSEYFSDSHFGRGLNNQDGVVSLLEGDGNEYLVIGEDTIAVVGVNKAIADAKQEAIDSATANTDTRINDVTSVITELSTTIAERISDVSNTLTSVNDSLTTEITNRENADNEINERINNVVSDLTNEISSRQNADVNVLNDAKSYADSLAGNYDIAGAAESALTNAKTYTDTLNTAMDGRVNILETKKVIDVEYDNGNKKIFLEFADGSVSNGFDASEFVVDGMLHKVEFIDAENKIVFEWNTDGGVEKVEVPLDKFVDQYTVSDDSKSYLAISEDNKINAIVDNANGFINTLASTDFVKTTSQNAVNELKTVVDVELEQVYTTFDTLSGTVTEVVYGNGMTSINHRIDNKFTQSLITDGLPATEISIEEAQKRSLLKEISLNGETRYYVSNFAEEMLCTTKEGESENLNTYILNLEAENNALKERVVVLEEKLANFSGDMEQTIKDVLKLYLAGTVNEIKVVEDTENDKLTIGFDDNAIFGEY